MKNPFRRSRKPVLNLTRPDPFPGALSDADVEAIREWSLRGVPTSAPITLGLVETLYRERGYR